MKEKALHDLLVKRFGYRYVRNLREEVPLQLNFESPNPYGPGTKCIDCAATQYRQDLPFWQGSLPKPYMLVAQDAGKGFEDPGRPEFNTVFSIHRLFSQPEVYLKEARHVRYHDYLRAMLPEADDLGSVYFTDLIKCAFSTGDLDASACPCRSDLLVEMAAVRPKVVVFFGAKAFSTAADAFQVAGSTFVPSGGPIRVRINSRQDLTIRLGRFSSRPELFIAIPQLGQNRFSKEGFANMLGVMKTQVRAAITSFMAQDEVATATVHVRVQG